MPPPVPGMPGGIGVNPLLPGAAAAGAYVMDRKAAKKMKKKMKKAHKMHKPHKLHKVHGKVSREEWDGKPRLYR